jgi:hypothetical protein
MHELLLAEAREADLAKKRYLDSGECHMTVTSKLRE